jgi:two-component system nitrate/nitrite response regulator NarL
VRILIVEDHPLTVAGLRTSLGAEHDIMHVIADGDEVIPWLRLNQVDLVTLDLSLPNRCGTFVLFDIQGLPHPPRVVIVTMHDDASMQKSMQGYGAHGFIAKCAPVAVFQHALAEIAAGRTWFPDRSEEDRSRRHSSRWTAGLRITRRQSDVLFALGDDLSRKATAARLQISEYTVDEHLAALRQAFRVATNPALIRAALGAGLLPQLWIPGRRPKPPE